MPPSALHSSQPTPAQSGPRPSRRAWRRLARRDPPPEPIAPARRPPWTVHHWRDQAATPHRRPSGRFPARRPTAAGSAATARARRGWRCCQRRTGVQKLLHAVNACREPSQHHVDVRGPAVGPRIPHRGSDMRDGFRHLREIGAQPHMRRALAPYRGFHARDRSQHQFGVGGKIGPGRGRRSLWRG